MLSQPVKNIDKLNIGFVIDQENPKKPTILAPSILLIVIVSGSVTDFNYFFYPIVFAIMLHPS